jgi:predicted RNA-binding protein YlqC (UPF0109 family)
MDIPKLLQYCVAKLVDNPEAITITHATTDGKSVYEVRVAPADLAKIIGKEGRTFKALRTLINGEQAEYVHDLVVDSIPME